MMNLNNLIRKNIKAMKPYSSARDEFKDLKADMVFLDANENPFETTLNRYPDPQQTALKELISKQKELPINQVLLGNGSDEVLDLIVRAFCEPNQDSILTLPPTYGMYGVLAQLNSIENIEVPLGKDFNINVDQVLKQLKPSTKLLFICSPNNPSGNIMDVNAVTRLLKAFDGLVVIDEAYIDFTTIESWTQRLNTFPNLMVTQTLSKAYGLAGIRLGTCYASKEIIAVLNKIKPPYNINSLTQQAAIEALQNNEVSEQVSSILREREKLANALASCFFVKKIYPSDANFILIKVDDANKRYDELLRHGIVIRNRTTQLGCENCLRISLGTPAENKQLLTLLNTLK
jgi:histidinol-phosphate aminotransferase|tara:strand:+ start:2244 stop:3281 length:1038 start_codon:yes stop_codon:yes gene_type:complete